jgi:hypothetical protein
MGARRDKNQRSSGLTEEQKQEIRCGQAYTCNVAVTASSTNHTLLESFACTALSGTRRYIIDN